MNAYKIAAYIPVSIEMMVDSLPLRTALMPRVDALVEHLQYGQAFVWGPSESVEIQTSEASEGEGPWDYDWYLPNLDWPNEDD